VPNRVILLAAAASAALAASLPAQSPASSVIGVDFFWVHNWEQNAQVSPLRYSGAGSAFALAYTTGTADWRAGLHVLYERAQLASGVSQSQEHTGSVRRIELTLPYERRLFGERSRLAGITLGAQLAGNMLYRIQSNSTMLSTEYFIDSFTWLAVAAGWQGNLGSWRLQYRAALPLLGAAWRTPYTGAKHMPSAQLTLPTTLLGLENRIALSRRLSRVLDLRASYEFQLLHHDATWELITASNRIGMGLDWHLRPSAALATARSIEP
jgi:hypothetical protein